MKQKGEWVDPLKRLIKYHEEIWEYVENLEDIHGLGYPNILYEKEGWDKIKPIEDFFKRNVTEHFAFEEEIVFPAILAKVATPEAIKLIPELQKEHRIILEELKEFQKIISAAAIPLDEETSLKLNVVGKRIINSLQRHAAEEDKKLLPIVKKNRQIF